MTHHYRRQIFCFLAPAFMFFGLITLSEAANDPDVYLVSFTADWCPNCVILDPKLDAAMSEVDEDDIEHVVLDMTNGETRADSFEEINGTVLAEVYGDHLGVTGIGILAAADSGEKLGCVNRTHSVEEIVTILAEAQDLVRDEAPNNRSSSLGSCPRANQKIAQ